MKDAARSRRGVLQSALCRVPVRSPAAPPHCLLRSANQNNVAPTPTLPAAPAAPLTVAWAENGDLMTWTSANPTPRRIASGGVIRPFLAPDGAQVAYLRGPEGQAFSLWISDTPGSAERQLLDTAALADGGTARYLAQIVWSPDSRAIYFNTQVGAGMEARPADDLWRIDPQNGTIERLLADGDGGQIFFSPDGSRIALASTGEYRQPGAPRHAGPHCVLYLLHGGGGRAHPCARISGGGDSE